MKQDDHQPVPSLAKDAAYENSFKAVYLAANATGLRPYGFRHRAQGSFAGPQVAEDFLVNSRLRRSDREMELSAQGFYFGAAAVMYSLLGHESASEPLEISLPEPGKLRMEIGEAMRRRRSCTGYSGERLALGDLATLLWCANGVTERAELEHSRGGRTFVNLRTTPSGGALYPIELYVVALNISKIPRGIYRYDSLKHLLLGSADSAPVDNLLRTFCLGDEQILDRANAIFLMVARPWRAMRKYGPRGMRHVFMEAGYIAQNVHLGSVSMGLGSLDCSSIYDDEAHEVLGVDGIYEALIHTIVVGLTTNR